jgi:hypothetical protein
MSMEDLDALLERMPKIAEAVNAFSSEAVQHEALQAMMAAFSGTSQEPVVLVKRQEDKTPDATEAETDAPEERNRRGSTRKKRNGSKSSWSLNKGLDLHPSGKESFEDFLAAKQPAAPLSDQDMMAAVVYYLSEVLELPKITIDDVGTVIRRTPGRKEPTNLPGVLRNAQGRKATIDCGDLQDIKLTSAGRNFVEHNLPVKVKTKK